MLQLYKMKSRVCQQSYLNLVVILIDKLSYMIYLLTLKSMSTIILLLVDCIKRFIPMKMFFFLKNDPLRDLASKNSA